nr:heavy metal sensor histidine kinase [Alcaligenes faecalis]
MSRSNSIRGRLSRWLAIQTLISVGLICIAVYLAISLNFATRQTELLTEKQRAIQHLASESASKDSSESLQHQLLDFFHGHPELSLVLQSRSVTKAFGKRPSNAKASMFRQLTFTLPEYGLSTGPIQAQLSMDITSDVRFLRRLALALFICAILGAVLASLGAAWLVRRALTPIDALSSQVEKLSPERLGERLEAKDSVAEIRPLIAQFNALLERIEGAYAQIEEFNANLAHELRTPLATLIGETELALSSKRYERSLNEMLASNLEDFHRMERVISDILLLARADGGTRIKTEPTNSIAITIREVMDYHEAQAEDADVKLLLVGDASAMISRTLFQRAVSNLLSNAIRHADAFSDVLIVVETADEEVRIAVCNLGAPVAQEHLVRCFGRFVRLPVGRESSDQDHFGLGLAIVAAIARMHGGKTFARSVDRLVTMGFTVARAIH